MISFAFFSIQRLSKSKGGENHVLKFPEDKTLYDVDWLGIIDRKNKNLYSRVLVDDHVKASIPKMVTLDPLKGRNGLSSAEIIVLDSRTLVIKNFNFKGIHMKCTTLTKLTIAWAWQGGMGVTYFPPLDNFIKHCTTISIWQFWEGQGRIKCRTVFEERELNSHTIFCHESIFHMDLYQRTSSRHSLSHWCRRYNSQ